MASRRARFVLPAALALVIAGLPVTSAASAAPASPPDETGVSGVTVVSTLAADATLYGIEVSERTISWGQDDADYVGSVGVRGYTPDLGRTPLSLGSQLAPAFEGTIVEAATSAWAVGFNPGDTVDDDFTMYVRPAGGAPFTVVLGGDLYASSGGVQVWGDTALLGIYAVNLNTREVFRLPVGTCAMPVAPVLADGALIFADTCRGWTWFLEVPEDGITAELLADDEDWLPILPVVPDRMAYSEGLFVFGFEDLPETDGPAVGSFRLDAGEPVPWLRALDAEFVDVRADGHRFVVVTHAGGYRAEVFEEGQAEDADPVAAVTLDPWLMSGVVPEDLAAARVALPDTSSAMDTFGVPVDLKGRTLAWSTGEAVVAGTLPPLSGGAVSASVPSSAKAGTAVTVSASGLLPGEEVALWLESTPVLLGTVVADANGNVSASVTIPAGTEGGAHTLTVHGVESGWSAARAISVAAAAANPGLRIDTGR